jgi:hypothetical protein
MPSLIYITRIRPLSAELAQALESSGVHVKSFGPGEITADECVLVMTSEAVLAGLQASGLASLTAGGRTKGTESRGTPPLQDIPKHLGAEAAVWNCIKAAELRESAARESTATSGQRFSEQRSAEQRSAEPVSSVSAAVPVPDHLGLVSPQKAAAPSQGVPVAQKLVRGSDDKSGVPLLPVPSMGKAGGEWGPVSTLTLKATGFSDRIRAANGKNSKWFWQPPAMAAALLIFAMILLAGRASILPSTADLAVIDQTSGSSGRAGISAKVPNLEEARRHRSDYDFVAADYTTHFDLHAHPEATPRTPDLRNGAQSRLVRKRVVVN